MKKQPKQIKRYTSDLKLKVVKLFLEEGYTSAMLSEEFGVAISTLHGWVKIYRQDGERAFQPKVRTKLPKVIKESPLKSQIIAHKESNPYHGAKRISQVFKRFLGLEVSTHEVRETLREESLLGIPPKPKAKNDPKPRFFERANPNQLWQTDIMTFRLAGHNAYLIGFIDDYSRYIVGLGAYRSQTTENVLETIKVSFGEYGIPKEVLSDNGRQYHNWRGVTRFEKLLTTHRIKCIRSRPHHPMTCGKIERFWQTIQQEFLFKCQFDSFENFHERLNLWVKYYNFKRPHQGIGGMCPADRYFEIQHTLKATLKKSITENTQELALRGKVNSPFYMVGRMGDQNVSILAEKGKIIMHLDDSERPEGRQIEYDLNAKYNENVKKIIMPIGENENETISAENIIDSSKGASDNLNYGNAELENTPAIIEESDPLTREMQSNSGVMVGDTDCECSLSGVINITPTTGTLGGISDDRNVTESRSSKEANSSNYNTPQTLGEPVSEAFTEDGTSGEEVGTFTRKIEDNLTCTIPGANLNITLNIK